MKIKEEEEQKAIEVEQKEEKEAQLKKGVKYGYWGFGIGFAIFLIFGVMNNIPFGKTIGFSFGGGVCGFIFVASIWGSLQNKEKNK